MTRDEALLLQSSMEPCFYTGDILRYIKCKPIYIKQVTRAGETLQAARVGLSPTSLYYKDVWVKLHELSMTRPVDEVDATSGQI